MQRYAFAMVPSILPFTLFIFNFAFLPARYIDYSPAISCFVDYSPKNYAYRAI